MEQPKLSREKSGKKDKHRRPPDLNALSRSQPAQPALVREKSGKRSSRNGPVESTNDLELGKVGSGGFGKVSSKVSSVGFGTAHSGGFGPEHESFVPVMLPEVSDIPSPCPVPSVNVRRVICSVWVLLLIEGAVLLVIDPRIGVLSFICVFAGMWFGSECLPERVAPRVQRFFGLLCCCCPKMSFLPGVFWRQAWLGQVAWDGAVLENLPQVARKDRGVVLRAVWEDGGALQYACEALRKDHEVVRAAWLSRVRMNGNALRSAPAALKSDRALVYYAIRKHGEAFEFASADLRADRQLAFLAVRSHGFAMAHASDDLRADEALGMAALRQIGITGHNTFREALLAGIEEHGGDLLELAPPELRADKEVVLAAVKRDGHALQHAADELRSDWDVAVTAFRQLGLADTRSEKRSVRQLVLNAVEHRGFLLAVAPKEVRSDREVVLLAVANEGTALSFASKKLRNDKEVVLAAFRGFDGLPSDHPLQHASDGLRSDLEVVVAAFTAMGFNVPPGAERSHTVWVSVIQRHTTWFQHAPLATQENPDVACYAYLCDESH